jgi:hypothetical protein
MAGQLGKSLCVVLPIGIQEIATRVRVYFQIAQELLFCQLGGEEARIIRRQLGFVVHRVVIPVS